MDRHVIANMGAELGATTTVFPADEQVRAFLRAGGARATTSSNCSPTPTPPTTSTDDDRPVHPRAADRHARARRATWSRCARSRASRSSRSWSGRRPTRGCATSPSSPRSCDGRQAHPRVSFDVNPTSRQILADLTTMGGTLDLIAAGARLHQAGCMGCIGMGQAPAIGGNSLRTVPRNFPGRSGTDGGLGLPVLPGDGGRGRADRPDHRSPRPAATARHRLPADRAAGAGPA